LRNWSGGKNKRGNRGIVNCDRVGVGIHTVGKTRYSAIRGGSMPAAEILAQFTIRWSGWGLWAFLTSLRTSIQHVYARFSLAGGTGVGNVVWKFPVVPEAR